MIKHRLTVKESLDKIVSLLSINSTKSHTSNWDALLLDMNLTHSCTGSLKERRKLSVAIGFLCSELDTQNKFQWLMNVFELGHFL